MRKTNRFDVNGNKVRMLSGKELKEQKKKKGGFGKKLIAVLVSCSLAFSAATLFSDNVQNIIEDVAESYSVSDELGDYLMQTDLGTYIKLPVDENPINIVLQNIPEEDKQKVVSAIRDLDNISTNLDYKILETDDVTITDKIYITDGETPSDALGLTDISYNVVTGKIKYPVYIKIDMDACHRFISDITGEDAVSAVTKHELGHAHGFKDIYESSKRNETIMWYSIYGEDYTQADKERYREYYGGVAEDVSNKYEDYLKNKYDVNYVFEFPKKDEEKDCLYDNKKLALRMIHKDKFAEIYEPAHFVITNEMEKATDKINDIKKKDEEIEREF